MRHCLTLVVISMVAIAAVACGSDGATDAVGTVTGVTSTPASSQTALPAALRMLQPGDSPAPPVGALDTSKSYTATFKTEKGDIVIELFDDIAPLFVENFVNLARIGFYDNTTFHRVLANFMAQGGDPTGTGSGGPGYRFPDQFHPDMRHDGPGILSMANAGANTNGSQFFITHGPERRLDPVNPDGSLKACGTRGVSCHGVFGKVIEGMDVLLSIRLRDPASDTRPGDAIFAIEIAES
jgi:cyclophilin family peptidyl-prolyl cis-trans isomerase